MTDDLSQPATAAAEPEKPSALPTMTQTKPTLRDLFTGGWQPQAALPTALGRPLARLGTATRTTWHRWTSGGSTQQ